MVISALFYKLYSSFLPQFPRPLDLFRLITLILPQNQYKINKKTFQELLLENLEFCAIL